MLIISKRALDPLYSLSAHGRHNVKKEKIHVISMSSNPANIYMSRSGVFILNFEHISHLFLLIYYYLFY